MISPELIVLLRCPEDHSELKPAAPELVAQLNRSIAEGRLRNCSGQGLGERLDGALVRVDGRRAYPVIDGIPVMLADQAILLDQLTPTGGPA